MSGMYKFSNYRGGAGSQSPAARTYPSLSAFHLGRPPGWPKSTGHEHRLRRMLGDARAARLARQVLRRHMIGAVVETGITVLQGYKEAQPQSVLFFPPSSYVLQCDMGGSGTELSSLYSGPICMGGQHISGGNPPTADSPRVSEITPSVAPFPNGARHRGWARIAPAEAAPQLIPATPEVPAIAVPQTAPQPKRLFWPRFRTGRVRPRTSPAADPATMVQPEYVRFSVGRNGRFNVNYRRHDGTTAPRHRPPSRRERERKYRGPPWLMQPAYALTEAADFIDALYGALPDEYKLPYVEGRRIGMWDKLRQVIEHEDKIDIRDAFWAVKDNEVIDRMIGGIMSERPIMVGSGRPYFVYAH